LNFFPVDGPTVTVELHDEISTAESLQFDFRTIRVATDNFSIDNKLGEGGFGSVYKVTLACPKCIMFAFS